MNTDAKPAAPRGLIVTAWAVTLFASILPEIFWNETGGSVPGWFLWARLGVFAALLVAALAWQRLRPLRDFFALWIVLIAATQLTARIDFNLPFLQDLLGGSRFVDTLQPEQFGKLSVTLIVLLALRLLGKTRRQLFLTPGKLDAPIAPVKWMGFPKPDPWYWFGGQYGFYIAMGMALAAWLMSQPSTAMLTRVVPILPAIVLFAAMNAFNEEMTLRASMLATLEPATGTLPAWWMSALYFGIAHFYGIPYGWIGIGLATFNGWLLGKAMLETRGLFWAWWMHFLQDVAIFVFLSAGAITPGG